MSPTPISRPPFDAWRYSRRLTLRATAALINERAAELGEPVRVSHEKVRTLCLPIDDPARTTPDEPLRKVIEALTESVVNTWPPVRSAA